VTTPAARQTFVFGTSEYRGVPSGYVAGGLPLREAHRLHDGSVVIVTCSNWSRDGFIASGADPERTVVVPLGFDPSIFYPPTPSARLAAREKLDLGEDEFVFLHVGAMTGNKNPEMLLRGFAAVIDRYPKARLILKGSDALYPSCRMFMSAVQTSLTGDQARAVFDRVKYIGNTFSFCQMAELYHAADCYLSPYSAEAFNLPVLEAGASGLPVICTAGGPTDDFVEASFARRIKSREVVFDRIEGVDMVGLAPDAADLEDLMLSVVEDREFRLSAFRCGPAHVAEHFTWKHVVDSLSDLMGAGA
jgi:glycosyltransferase involved in cell wall biosynthesis